MFGKVWKLVERHRDDLGGEWMAGVDCTNEIRCDKPVDGLLYAILIQFSDTFYEYFLNELLFEGNSSTWLLKMQARCY